MATPRSLNASNAFLASVGKAPATALPRTPSGTSGTAKKFTYTPGVFSGARAGAPRGLQVGGGLTTMAKKKGPKSVLGQLGDIGSGLLPGLIGFGTDVAKTAVAPIRLGVDVARGELGGKNLWEIAQRELPAVTGMAESFGQTGLDIVNPARLAQASEEGTIVGKILEDIGNIAIVTGPIGKTLGTAGGVAGEAGARAVAEAAGRAAVPKALAAVESAARATPFGTVAKPVIEAAAVEAAPAVIRGTGLAGLAARGGAPELARSLETVGRGVRTVGSLGERTGVAQGPAAIFATPYKGLSWGAERLFPKALEGGLAGPVKRGLQSGWATRNLFPWTEQGRRFGDVEGERHAAKVEAQARPFEAVEIARKAGLDEADTRTAMILADSRMAGMAPTLRKMSVEDASAQIRDMYSELLDERMIVQPEHVLDALDMEAAIKSPDALKHPNKKVRGIRQVLDDLADQERVASELELAGVGTRGEGLSPEQRGAEFLSPVMAKLRGKFEKARKRLLTSREPMARKAAHNRRVEAAYKAIYDSEKATSSPRQMFAKGRAAQRDVAKATAAERAARTASGRLETLVDEYVAKVEAGDANVEALGAQLEELAARAQAAADAAVQANRRVDARMGLSKATGEIVSAEAPGALVGEAPPFRTTEVVRPLPAGVQGPPAPETMVIPPSPTALTAPPTVGLERAIGQEQLLARQAGQAETAAARDLTRGETRLTRAQEAAAAPAPEGVINRINAAEARAGELGEAATEARAQAYETTPAGKERVPVPKTDVMRLAERWGAAHAKAQITDRQLANIDRGIERANRRIGNLPEQMARGVQSRMRETNDAFISAELGRIRRQSDTLITVGDEGYIGGVMGDTLDAIDASEATRQWVATEWDQALRDTGNETMARSQLLGAIEDNGLLRDVDAQFGMPEGYFADRLTHADYIDSFVETMNGELAKYAAKDLTLQSPRVLFDLIEKADQLPQDVRNAASSRRQAWEKNLTKTLVAATDDYLAVVPKAWRQPLVVSRRGLQSLLERADEMEILDPEGAYQLRLFAEEVPTTLQELLDMGVEQPLHMVGDVPPRRAGAVTGAGPAQQRGTIRTLTTEQQARQNLTAATLEDYVRRFGENETTRMNNHFNERLGDEFGVEMGDIVGYGGPRPEGAPAFDTSTMSQLDIRTAVENAGYKLLDQRQPYAGLTKAVPEPVAKRLLQADTVPGGAWKLLTRMNRAFKTMVLPFSLRWHTGNTIGGTIQSMVHGGLNPYELVQRLREAAKESGGWKELLTEREGLTASAPRNLSTRGLTAGEQQFYRAVGDEQARTALGRGVQRFSDRSYRVNNTVDSLFKSAVYLQEKRRGLPSDAAAHGALKALGDFQNLSPFERNKVRQIIPFYTWIKHQTTAFMRLPLYHPARAAWVGHLASMYQDDDSFRDFVNGRIPLGFGDYVLNIESLSPIPLPGELPFFPENLTRAITPFGRTPLQIAGVMPTSQPIGVSGAPYRRPGDAAYMALGALPITRPLRDLAWGPEVRRYGTGQQTTKAGRKTGRTIANDLASLAGVWFPERRVNPKGQYVDEKGEPIKKVRPLPKVSQ